MRSLLNTYDALLNAIIKNEHITFIDENDKVYTNFMDEIFNEMKHDEYFDYDIFEEIIYSHLRDIDVTDALKNKSKYLEELQAELTYNFNKDIRDHFLIVPIQKSALAEDIIFDDFLLLKKRSNEDDYFRDISNYLGIQKDRVKSSIEHTHNTRSKDFLKDNIIIVKVKQQTSYVKTFATSIMIDIFSYIRIIYFLTESTTSYLQSHLAYWNTENKHVLILAEDNWRQGHGYRGETPNFILNYDLNFLKEKNNQELLSRFLHTFTLNRKKDDLTRLFYNAINLFDSGIKFKSEDNDIYNLLMMTTAETLLTQGANEKRLRLSAVSPKLINHSKLNKFQISKVISDFYLSRNSFVHGGESRSNFERSDYELLAQIISKLIVYYFTFSNEIVEDNHIKRINQWSNYINKIFESIIYGNEDDEGSTKKHN